MNLVRDRGHRALETVGIATEAIELNQIDVADLQTATHVVVVTSTFGDGEFPDNATLFWEAISGETARLEHLSFAVLALGDTSYDLFCHAGKVLDERLEQLGATRLAERVDIDGFYEQPAKAWSTDVVMLLAAERTGPEPAVVVSTPETQEADVQLDLAFSRHGADRAPKTYVQQRMREHATEFFDWLSDGAHVYVYVCGDAERMAKDVAAALHDIIAKVGGMDAAAARAYVNDLIRSHRYLRDVY